MSQKISSYQHEISDEVKSYLSNENFEKMLKDFSEKTIEEGKVITGKVIAIENNDLAVVDIGYKTEGRVPLKEFKALNDKGEPTPEQDQVQVGDEVEVFLERTESADGAVLSREKALREKSWIIFEKAHEKGENVDGIIFGRVKGGFTVDLGGAVAFLPGSQVDVRPVKDITPLMGITQPFQILKMDRVRGNIVVSRRAILEESRSAEREEVLSNISEGDVLEGVVKNVTDYGAFIDLGAVDGLLHVTDISWRRISHPTEVLSVGDTVKVKVIKFDQEDKRISLGMKQLEESPWQDIGDRFALGTRHKGRVTNITDYGAFVELDVGIEGLVHVSEMSWTKKNVHPSRIVSASQEVEVEVLEIDPEKHRISLGIKQCIDNPWANFAKGHSEGDTISGEIKNITEFGIFVGLSEGVDGLVHVSDVTWESNPEEALKAYKKGDTIEAKLLSVEVENERISLGVKQLQSDPFEDTLDKMTKGSVMTLTVSDVTDDGIEVTVAEGLTSFIKKSDLSKDREDQRPERFAAGDRVDAKITNIKKKDRSVTFSIKAMEIEQEKESIEAYGSPDSGASLGEILGVALENVKPAEEASKEKATKAEEKPKAKKAAAKEEDAPKEEKKATKEEKEES